jgi:hypothetical protein
LKYYKTARYRRKRQMEPVAQKVNPAKKLYTGTNKESRKAMARALQNVAEQNLELRQKIQELEKQVAVLFQNQRELAKSETRLDEQFCVSTRLAIYWINSIIKAARMEDAPWALSMDSVTYEEVNKMFMDFEEFRSRPDFRNHMRVWFLGEPLDSLPELKVEADHAVSHIGNEAGTEERAGGGREGQEDPVPVRREDAAETGS